MILANPSIVVGMECHHNALTRSHCCGRQRSTCGGAHGISDRQRSRPTNYCLRPVLTFKNSCEIERAGCVWSRYRVSSRLRPRTEQSERHCPTNCVIACESGGQCLYNPAQSSVIVSCNRDRYLFTGGHRSGRKGPRRRLQSAPGVGVGVAADPEMVTSCLWPPTCLPVSYPAS